MECRPSLKSETTLKLEPIANSATKGASMNTRAAIYARKSTGKETDNRSIPEQIDLCQALAQTHGWIVDPLHIYKEVASGKTIADRKEMQKLLRAMSASEFQHIICYRNDRRARNMKESGYLDVIAEQVGVQWNFVDTGMVPDSLEDEDDRAMFGSWESYLDAKERRKIVTRFSDGHETRKKAGGRRQGPKNPYGWKHIDLEPDATGRKRRSWTMVQVPEQAAVVAEMYRRLVDGSSLSKVVQWLQTSDHLTPAGHLPQIWSATAVKSIIRNPANYGRNVTNRWERMPGTSAAKERPESEWVELVNAEPLIPIVSESIWRSAVASLTENRKRSGGKKSPDNMGLLSYGVAVCACTDHRPLALRWHKDGRYKGDAQNFRRYGCPQVSISSRRLDEDVWRDVVDRLQDPAAVAQEVNSLVSGDAAKEMLKDATNRVKRLRNKEQNLLQSIEDTDNREMRKTFMTRLEAITTECEQAELARQSIVARAKRTDAWKETTLRFMTEALEYTKGIDNYDLDQKRAALQKLQAKVYIGPKGYIGPSGRGRWHLEIGVPPPGFESGPDDDNEDPWSTYEFTDADISHMNDDDEDPWGAYEYTDAGIAPTEDDWLDTNKSSGDTREDEREPIRSITRRMPT